MTSGVAFFEMLADQYGKNMQEMFVELFDRKH
jgi:hypothetical protein